MIMEGSDGSPPLSLGEIVRAAELFPKSILEKEDEKLTIPFNELPGESVKFIGRTDDGVLAISNYRLFLFKSSINLETSVPLGLVETAQVRDLFHLIINCKDANTIKCSFPTSENCAEWQRRIGLSVGVPDKLESLFAFPFYAWTSETLVNDNEWSERLRKGNNCDNDFWREVKRLKFDLNSLWRISEVNIDFKLCPSYPRYMLVPFSISDETLQNVASFRSSRRIPSVVWRHRRTGAVIARCSQPEVGWLGWRNSKDEQLLKAISDACEADKPYRLRYNSNTSDINSASSSSPNDNNIDKEISSFSEPKKILIVDARSYTSAVTNRARGGGCECAEYYPCAEIQFMNLGNIHAIRKSFHAVRQLCASPPDVPNWLGLLERTAWLQHMSGLLAASMVVSHAIERQGRPVLVHCSDGWDRTPQIVATAQLCLDPYYRTVDGFRLLCEREWLNFGHKFADRCGHGPESDENNERCPVFLQWLDCIHQIHRQFPCSFEFSMGYLIKLAQHSNSCLFGTFLCNTEKERSENTVNDRTFSVWPFLSGPIYKNPLYVPNREKVLWPAHNVRDLVLWSEVYLGSLGNQNSLDGPPKNTSSGDGGQDSLNLMIKTRSYGDLLSASELQAGMARRSSDPSMSMDSHILTPLNNSSENSIDSSSDRENSPTLLMESNIMASLIMRDTTNKLQNLTNDLNQSDEDELLELNHQNLFLNNNLDSSVVINKNNNVINTKNINSDTVKLLSKCDEIDDDINAVSQLYYNRQFINVNDKVDVGDKTIEKLKTNNIIAKFENGENKTIELNFNSDKDLTMQNSNGGDESDFFGNLLEKVVSDSVEDHLANGTNGVDKVDGFTGNEVMLQSIDLNDSSLNNSPVKSPQLSSQNLWYGSVDTSTDTLVPIESKSMSTTTTPTAETPTTTSIQIDLMSNSNVSDQNNDDSSKIKQNNQHQQNGHLLNGDQFDGGGNTNGRVSYNSNYIDHHMIAESARTNGVKSRTLSSCSQMDESIVIQPEYERLDINGGHKLDRRKNSLTNNLSPVKLYLNGSTSPSVTNSRFSTPGGRSLPVTPPATDRPAAVTIYCPDGLAHALSEQNLRLQQIVYEHKLREQALARELYATRLELLKKTCQQCSTHAYYNNEEPCSINDSNLENASVCSWEAVDDGAVNGNGLANINLNQPLNDLWVPDHAVNQCTGCNMVFWLGRRKHHCRSCGQIFCADCSEYRASLPDKRLYATVRLCATCYNNQVSTQPNNSTSIINSQDRVIPPISTINIHNNSKHQLSSKPPPLDSIFNISGGVIDVLHHNNYNHLNHNHSSGVNNSSLNDHHQNHQPILHQQYPLKTTAIPTSSAASVQSASTTTTAN